MRPIFEPWTTPRETGGWCCSECGRIITHEELIGINHGSYFVVHGYHCVACQHEWINDRYVPMPKRRGNLLTALNWREMCISIHSFSSTAHLGLQVVTA